MKILPKVILYGSSGVGKTTLVSRLKYDKYDDYSQPTIGVAFCVMECKIGEKTIAINANETYFIPPNSDHVFWTDEEEPLVLIWLAWGEGA